MGGRAARVTDAAENNKHQGGAASSVDTAAAIATVEYGVSPAA